MLVAEQALDNAAGTEADTAQVAWAARGQGVKASDSGTAQIVRVHPQQFIVIARGLLGQRDDNFVAEVGVGAAGPALRPSQLSPLRRAAMRRGWRA
jgi:hypothetical protein